MDFRDVLALKADMRVIQILLINAELSRLGLLDDAEYADFLKRLAKNNQDSMKEISDIMRMATEGAPEADK